MTDLKTLRKKKERKRPGEALALVWGDIVSTWEELQTCGISRVENPKIGSPPIQHVLTESRAVVRDILHVIWRSVGSPRDGKIKLFAWRLERLFIGSLRFSTDDGEIRHFTVGGLRAGAATADYVRTQNTGRARWRGRWASDTVLKHYIQLGTYYASATEFSEPTLAAIDTNRAKLRVFVITLC